MPHLGVFFLQLPVCVRQIDHDGFYKADIEFLMHHGCHATDFRRQQQIKVVTAAKKTSQDEDDVPPARLPVCILFEPRMCLYSSKIPIFAKIENTDIIIYGF